MKLPNEIWLEIEEVRRREFKRRIDEFEKEFENIIIKCRCNKCYLIEDAEGESVYLSPTDNLLPSDRAILNKYLSLRLIFNPLCPFCDKIIMPQNNWV
jgi:hypothetical protein